MRIAVIGCGSIGRRHLNNLAALGQADVIAFDPSGPVRRDISRSLGVDCLGELKSVWSTNPQVVLVTAPTDQHLPLALESVRRGCHVFIEKPLAPSLRGVSRLRAEIRKRSVITMVGCNMRFHPGPAIVKDLISRNRIGTILAMRIQTGSYLPAWRKGQNYKASYSASLEFGGAILDCIHEIDLALWYAGPAELLFAAGLSATSIRLQTDGLAEILLRHENSVLTSVHLNFVQRDYRRSCQVIGTEGTIYWDFEQARVDVYGPAGKVTESILEPDDWDANQMYLDELSHFLACVTSGRPTVNAVADAVPCLKIAVAARRRARL